MDRRNFIMQNFTDVVNCGLDDCACEETILSEKQAMEKIRPLHLLMIAIGSLVCAMSFSLTQNNEVNAIILQMKSNSIACGPVLMQQEVLTDHRSPSDKNKGNDCPHQSNVSCMACSNDPKFKRNKQI